MKLCAASLLTLAMALAPLAGARAGELKILAGGSMTASLNELGLQFERASGHKLTIVFDSTPNLIKTATSGAPFDLGVVPVDGVRRGRRRRHQGGSGRQGVHRLSANAGSRRGAQGQGHDAGLRPVRLLVAQP
jgi:molybdate transport system substrate-binding protein